MSISIARAAVCAAAATAALALLLIVDPGGAPGWISQTHV